MDLSFAILSLLLKDSIGILYEWLSIKTTWLFRGERELTERGNWVWQWCSVGACNVRKDMSTLQSGFNFTV